MPTLWVEQPAPVERSSSTTRAVLISGASFAGLATAYWMNRLGYRVTLVEFASGLRRGGTPVGLEGEALDALDRMGVLDAVRAKALPPRRFEFKASRLGGQAQLTRKRETCPFGF